MSWVTPYIGRTDMHCWGLIRDVFSTQLGIELPIYGEVNAKELQAVAEAVVAGTTAQTTWRSVQPFPSAEQPYDVVVMRGWLPSGEDRQLRRGVIHTGIVTRPRHVMHTDMGYAVVELPLSHPTVRGKLVGCYRHVDLVRG